MEKRLNKAGDMRGMMGTLPKDLTGPKNGKWKGGIHIRADGYIVVRRGVIPRSAKGARYTLLHRLLMEAKLGRKLLRSEIVHHKDHNNRNNSLDNLEIMTAAEHARHHFTKHKKV